MSEHFIGIDPGGHGAIAVLDEAGQLHEVEDMPALAEANGRAAERHLPQCELEAMKVAERSERDWLARMSSVLVVGRT